MKQKIKASLQITAIADLTVVFSILFFMTQTLDAFNFPKQMVFSAGIFALLAAIFIHGVSVPNFRESKIIILAILSIVLGTILLSIPNNLFGQLTLWGEFSRANGLMTRIPLFILVLIYAIYSSEKGTDRFFKWMMALLIIEVIYGIVQLTGIDPVPWVNPYNNIFVTTGNPNFAAALFAVLVVLTFRFLLMDNSFLVKFLSVTCIIAGSFMSWSTKSVQGVLTISAAIFLVLLIFFFPQVPSVKSASLCSYITILT